MTRAWLPHDEVLKRWKRGDTSSEIAQALKLRGSETVRVIVRRARTRGDVRAVVHENRPRDKYLHIRLPLHLQERLEQRATKESVSRHKLVERLVATAIGAHA